MPGVSQLLNLGPCHALHANSFRQRPYIFHVSCPYCFCQLLPLLVHISDIFFTYLIFLFFKQRQQAVSVRYTLQERLKLLPAVYCSVRRVRCF